MSIVENALVSMQEEIIELKNVTKNLEKQMKLGGAKA